MTLWKMIEKQHETMLNEDNWKVAGVESTEQQERATNLTGGTVNYGGCLPNTCSPPLLLE